MELNDISMKKLLLLILSIFTFGLASAQIAITTPPDYSICALSDFAIIDLSTQTPMVLGGLSSAAYAVSYHESQADAANGTNQIMQLMNYTVFNGQVIFVRVQQNSNPAVYEVTQFSVHVNPIPYVSQQTFTACDTDNDPSDGMAYIDLGSISEQIWFGASATPNTMQITYYGTYADAEAQVNPFSNAFFSTTSFSTIYANCQYYSSGCSSITPISLSVVNCAATCAAPQSLVAVNISQTSATLAWTEVSNATAWEVLLLYAGGPFPLPTMTGTISATNPFVVTGLQCGESYDVYVRSLCDATTKSDWSQKTTFSTGNCSGNNGQPVNLAECAENGTACFDLTVNDSNVLVNLNPTDYTITYYTTEADASAGTAAIANPTSYCVPVTMASPMIYIRMENNLTGEYNIFAFAITAQEVVAGNISLQPMVQCDEDANGAVIFNLTAVSAQLNTSNQLSFYTDSNDAIAGINAIANPSAFSMNVVNFSMTIFIREIVAGNCDIIYSLPLNAMGNCNVATICAAANSLCNSLGVPFSNTTNGPTAEPGNNYGCLGSQPNPTWFYIPVSAAGAINLQITQTSNIGNPIDVDYICYGPFANPVTPCSGMLNANAILSCSYSTAAVENVSIPNAQPGQYYLLMVTNFSNQGGHIVINQTSGQGEIDCTGIRLNAFLDANSNGVKDGGEQNFPLGQFNYERNNDGNIHNITAPTGVYNIYDMNGSNSYDLGYTIDPAYAANYALTTASYNNVNVIGGGGMQQYLFPVTVVQSYNDLSVSIVPNQAPRPGFTYTNTILYSNLGTQTISGTVTFVKDALVTIVGNSQSGVVNNANGFSYNFTSLQPFETREITVTMQVPTIPTVTIGNALVNHASIVPLAGDVSPENNESVASQVIIGSYDPNDKMESHGERILITDFDSQDYLYYTVRFENTGTASAINVRISDVLDNKLDENSVRMVSASHDYVLDRIDNQLTWRFDGIQLPTTTQNPTGGKGYVYFKVKPKPGYAVGDIILNTASIFFDFNPAIVTNTFQTQFVASLGTGEFADSGFVVYPNPAGDHVTVALGYGSGTIAGIAVYDMLGKTMLSTKPAVGSTSEMVDVSGISSGIYFLEVTSGTNQKTVKKLVIE